MVLSVGIGGDQANTCWKRTKNICDPYFEARSLANIDVAPQDVDVRKSGAMFEDGSRLRTVAVVDDHDGGSASANELLD